ncbi:hypothetical protein NBRC116583_12710 [Arenicella sp. 4NH20-0111]|uniref:hypothetical protein n=1 Tax=Arenicella sp. 4NH20-0111 TaxID=3127648 RepID=UPI00310B17AD
MEQSKVCTATPRKFSDDLTAAYEHINTYRNAVNVDDEQAGKSKSKNIALIAIVAFLIFVGITYAALRFLPPETWGESTEGVRLFLQLVVLLIYILGGGVVLLQYFSVKDIYKDFTGQIIDGAADTANEEATLFEAFDGLSTQSIEYVANRLEDASTRLGQIRSFLLGAIEKIGIIPGLLATVLAINKVADSTGVSWIELLSVLMLGIYVSMFPIFEASIKTKAISILLNQYLELFRSSDESRELENELQ